MELHGTVTKQHDEGGLRSTAIFSTCGRYRYVLSRMWEPPDTHDPSKVLVVIGLNPSTATELEDDPTIRRCIDYAERWGHHGLTMLNLFAYRATDPRKLRAFCNEGGDIVGGEPQETALELITGFGRRVLCAWGVHGHLFNRAAYVREMLAANGRDLVHLGLTKAGFPKHPLYLKADLQPEPWR